MNSLIVYYSRTGRTKKIAEPIHASLNGDIDEILDTKSRSGILGWLRAGRDAGTKKLTSLKNVDKDPADYDVVIIGSPSWNGTVSTPIRTYINQYKTDLQSVACFSTGDGEDTDVVDEMGRLLGNKVFAKMHLVRKKEVDPDNYHEKVEGFVGKIKSIMQ